MITFLLVLRHSRTASNILQTCRLSTTKDVVEEIIIPKRIPRGPTDILRALESTITRDPTAAHYKYHDDPFLIPTSNLSKRSYALSHESGRKAAHWVRQENSNLFLHREAEPMIQLFVPKMVYDENSNVLEEDLQKAIKDALVSDAITICNSLKNKGIRISIETKQSLLELLCYYNCNDPLTEEFIEERWFRQSNKSKERQRKTWRDGSLAEEIFIGMENSTGEAYCAIIQGMIKYGQVDRGWQLYEESQQKNLQLSTDTYNAILSAASFIKEGNELRWSLVIDTLNAMHQAKVKPNLGTLNAVLKAESSMGAGKAVKQCVLQTISEFRNLGIEPSLATFYYVLITFCKERGPRNLILNDIMNYIEGKHIKIRDLRDTFFFVTAMDVCRYHLNDSALAKRIHNLLLFGNNYDLVGDSYKESIYYRHYVSLMCESEPFDYFMENIYHKIVPHIYVPEVGVMFGILKSLEISGIVEYIPGLWSDIVIFEHSDRENIITLLLDIMVESNPSHTTDFPEKFAGISWNIWSRIMEQGDNNTTKLIPTGSLLGKILILLLRNKELSRATTVFEMLDKNHSIVGVPSFESLALFVDNCIENKLPNRAISCIQYAAERGFDDAVNLATLLDKSMTLDENHIKKLNDIVGSDFSSKQSQT